MRSRDEITFKPDPDSDPNEACQAINTPAEVGGPPTDWWTVTR